MRQGRLLYGDTPAGLRRQAQGGEIIKLVVNPDQAAAAARLLAPPPLDQFTAAVQVVGYTLPLTHGIIGLQEIMLHGGAVSQFTWACLTILAAGTLCAVLITAQWQFRRAVEYAIRCNISLKMLGAWASHLLATFLLHQGQIEPIATRVVWSRSRKRSTFNEQRTCLHQRPGRRQQPHPRA